MAQLEAFSMRQLPIPMALTHEPYSVLLNQLYHKYADNSCTIVAGKSYNPPEEGAPADMDPSANLNRLLAGSFSIKIPAALFLSISKPV